MSAKSLRETRPGGGRWLRGLGYLLYTLVAAAISLWLLFPAKSVQRFVGRALAGISPGIEWRVGSVKLQLPLMLRVGDVEGYTARNTKTPSLHINRLDIWPDWNTSVREQSLWFGYHLRIGAGVIHGRLQLQTREQKFAFYGTARTLQLESIPLLASRLGRNLQGTVSASYEGKGCPGSQNFCTWKVQCTLENGRLALVRPMLRHTALPFSQVSMLLRGVGRELTIAEGKIASPLGNGWFNGTLLLADDPLQSRLQLRGGLHPQPPFFEGIENTVALQSVRLELQEKPLPFSLSGTLLHPGVHFESLAMQMYALEKEMR